MQLETGVKKVVIVGPESTGKSTLCSQLSTHYKTLCCPEYAREYLHQNGPNYIYDELLHIAKGQLKMEDEYAAKTIEAFSKTNGSNTTSPILFVDTNMYVMKVWCEYVFNNCHQFILDEIVARKYDLYLLCNIDLAWVKDELREYPDITNRKKLFHIYKDLLVQQQVPWAIISGTENERMQNAISAIGSVFS